MTLIFISSFVNYTIGWHLGKSSRQGIRKTLLIASLFANLGLLGFFKYFGFFLDSFARLIGLFGLHPNISTLKIILPVGISFYTFQSLSYIIDIYRRQIQPTKDPLAFFAFVSFFPQLVAGPIERAKNMLPQFQQQRSFNMEQVKDGLRQILWGLFKKMVIADRLAPHVDYIFSSYSSLNGIVLVLGMLFFAIQIYCDFSGYSDIAIGTARLFGFRLMRNFAYPYFSRNIREFWRRWHISLSSWFRDYVYIPLGGRHRSKSRYIWNILVTFIISGFWHGADWTFIAWGGLHGIYYIIYFFLTKKQEIHSNTATGGYLLPSLQELSQMTGTFIMVSFAWIFFRADSFRHAVGFIKHMFVYNLFVVPGNFLNCYGMACAIVVFLFATEWVQRTKEHALQIELLPAWTRWTIYYSLIALIILFRRREYVPFIYFQF